MHQFIAVTTHRVPVHTPPELNDSIRRRTERTVRLYSAAGREAIDQRLEELDAEWDIERTLEANAATVSLAGWLLGATVSRKLFILPAAVAAFLLQHAIQGWCPPVRLFRRLGFRTAAEIAEERFALKALRGDFAGIQADPEPSGEDAVAAADI
ncbi:MAG: DUF2892 domain-containing protein [Planctomycetes bacterium]|nr:DUF2892 domain-containing protein [Planctomycetota bacterium]